LTERISECLELFSLRSGFYRGIDVKIAAVQSDETWYNLRTVILPVAHKTPTENEIPIDLEGFRILHKRIPTDKFPKLLTEIKNGISEIGGMKIRFFSEPTPSLQRNDYCRGDSGKSKERWNIEWPLDLYEWRSSNVEWQNQLSDIYGDVDMRLRCFDQPYKDIEEAILDLLQLPKYHFQKYQSRDSSCSVLLPNFVAIESARLEGEKLDVSAKFHESLAPEDLFLSIICYGRKTIRYREDFKGGKVDASSPFVCISKSFKVADVADVQLYLFPIKMKVHGHCDQKTSRNVKARLNLRVACHEVFDRESVILREWLTDPQKIKKDSKVFEYAVVTLLNMCGFSTEWIGFKNIAREAPDILAYSSEPELIVVGECTIKMPEPSKYELLKERAERVGDELGLRAIAVMFTLKSVSWNEKGKVWPYDVTTLTPKELIQLHDMAARAKPVREMLYVLTGRHW